MATRRLTFYEDLNGLFRWALLGFVLGFCAPLFLIILRILRGGE